MMLMGMIFAIGLMFALSAITIPDRTKIRPTTTPNPIPAQFKTPMTNPGPVRVAATGASSSGIPLVERCDTSRAGYLGFSLRYDVPTGAAMEDENAPVNRGMIVDGFAGVVPGSDVFVDPAVAPVPEGVFSGLTHTAPAAGVNGWRVGVGVTTTKIYFD